MIGSLQIDTRETFPHLGERAPIVEAVIECRTIAEAELGASALTELQAVLPDFPDHKPLRAVNLEVAVDAATGTAQGHAAADSSRGGFLLRTADHTRIAQFRRDGFALSWLRPYRDFGTFLGEAMRLWQVHRRLASPGPLERLGLRYINRLPLPHGGLRLEECIRSIPVAPEGLSLDLNDFMHQDTYVVPNSPYQFRLVVVSGPATAPDHTGELILDIDVMTSPLGRVDDSIIIRYLEEMRWLKNKAFFGLLTTAAKEAF